AYFPTSSFSSNVGEDIFMISVGVGAASTITSFELCIWTDTSGHGATTVMSQTITGLVDGWNQIALTTPYTLGTDAVFVGYRMTTSGYSIGCDDTPATGGVGDMLQDPTTGDITHLGAIGFGDMSIKAHVGSLEAVEAELVSVNNDKYIIAANSASVYIIGSVKNNGSTDISTFDAIYSINGGTPVAVYNVTPNAPIPFGGVAGFSHMTTADFSVAGDYEVELTISNINGLGDDSDVTDNSKIKTITSLSQEVQKKALHEVLTSSTCAPCATANPVIDGVVYENNLDKATLIKYQVSWPGAGDPYQNQESHDRVLYYGTTGVPDFKIDGINTMWGGSYNQSALDGFTDAPAIATISGTATLTGTTISVNVDFNAITDISGDLVAQIVVVEKTTTGNVGSNGETEFYNVMMKFLPGTSGTAITNFAAPYTAQNVTLSADLSATNVEDFWGLKVVAFLQDNDTKEVLQSEYISVASALNESSNSIYNIFPNPTTGIVNIEGTQDAQVIIYNMIGEVIYENDKAASVTVLDLSSYAVGNYIVKIINNNEVTTQKIVLTK
ncbi:MAG: T9SS type A sorting domain-containing protein, partial [Bacteroidales bacterium]|nr:T9SS type A sorting domain-containing protein [Bacteroidales bacterium]